jgi:hypothetical protein
MIANATVQNAVRSAADYDQFVLNPLPKDVYCEIKNE